MFHCFWYVENNFVKIFQSVTGKILHSEELLSYKNRGNGVFICWKDSFLFAVGNEKYWQVTNDRLLITFTNTGGHVEKDETMIEATKREVLEELGCDITLLPADKTIICELENSTTILQELKDNLPPILIYNSKKMKMSVCVYLGIIESNPNPQMEVPALLLLPPSLLRGGNLKILLDEGAEIYIQDKRKIPENSLLKPFGSAKILVEHWEEFLSIESFANMFKVD